MTHQTWRDEARATIQDVIREQGAEDIAALQQALAEAYPFGERKRYPYKVWLQEVSHILTVLRLKRRQAIGPTKLRDFWMKPS